MDDSIKVPNARICVADSVVMTDEEKWVRVYSNAPETVALQIRSRNGLLSGGYRGTRRNLIATASLGRDELIALRDTIDEALAHKGWAAGR